MRQTNQCNSTSTNRLTNRKKKHVELHSVVWAETTADDYIWCRHKTYYASSSYPTFRFENINVEQYRIGKVCCLGGWIMVTYEMWTLWRLRSAHMHIFVFMREQLCKQKSNFCDHFSVLYHLIVSLIDIIIFYISVFSLNVYIQNIF